jgi:hypothetical protein
VDAYQWVVWCNSRHINDKIADLPPENVSGAISKRSIHIWVSINDPWASECSNRLENWEAIGIANELRIVIVDNRLSNEIRPMGEIYLGSNEYTNEKGKGIIQAQGWLLKKHNLPERSGFHC